MKIINKISKKMNIWKLFINLLEGSIKLKIGIWFYALFMRYSKLKSLKATKKKKAKLISLDKFKESKMKSKMKIAIQT